MTSASISSFDFNPIFFHYNKITCADIHPQLPWIVVANEGGTIKLFDYRSRKLIYKYSFSDVDVSESKFFPQGSLGKEFFGRHGRKAELRVAKKNVISNIRIIKFLDQDVKLLKYIGERSILDESDKNYACFRSLIASKYLHLIIACSEHRVLLFDYLRYRFQELDFSLSESKAITCLECFAIQDSLAFGFANGTVIIIKLLTGDTVKLTTGYSKAIVKLHSYSIEKESYIVAVSSDGMWTKWKLGHKENLVVFKDVKSPYEVFDISSNVRENCFIILTEKGIVKRDYIDNKETFNVSRPLKRSLSAIYTFPGIQFSSEFLLLLAKDGQRIFFFDSNQSEILGVFFHIDYFLKPDKDKNHIQFVSIHPSRPWEILIASTFGWYLISVPNLGCPQFEMRTVVENEEKQRKLYLMEKGKIMTMDPSLLPLSGNLQLASSSKTVSWIGQLTNTIFQIQDPMEEYQFSISPSSLYLGIFYNNLKYFQIVSIASGQVIDKVQSVTMMVWSDTFPDRYAYINTLTASKNISKKKKDGGSTFTQYGLFIQTVNIWSVNQPAVAALFPVNQQPCIFGGFLIGFGFQSNLFTQKAQSKMNFYSWEGEAVGCSMPTPSSIQWDPLHRYCVFVYQDCFCIFELQPVFRLLEQIYDQLCGMIFINGFFIYTTKLSIKACFLTPLRSYQVFIALESTKALMDFTSAPSLVSNLYGCHLLHVLDDDLFLLNGLYQRIRVSLIDPVFQFYSLVSSNSFEAAINMVPLINPEHHAILAIFLEWRGQAHLVTHLTLPLEKIFHILLKNNMHHLAGNVFSRIIEDKLAQKKYLQSSHNQIQLREQENSMTAFVLDVMHKLPDSGAISLNILLRASTLLPKFYRYVAIYYAGRNDRLNIMSLYEKMMGELGSESSEEAKKEAKYVIIFLNKENLRRHLDKRKDLPITLS